MSQSKERPADTSRKPGNAPNAPKPHTFKDWAAI